MKAKERTGEKIRLTSVEELLGINNEENAVEIGIHEIHGFKGHPFKVLDDEKMQDLVESIRINGVLTPVLVRPDDHGGYEMISGHRRKHAAQLAGLAMIPAIIRDMSDDEATIAMVDANIQREELLPSEKAFAYKMKLEAMKHQGVRKDSTCAQFEHKSDNEKSRDIVANQVGISRAQVSRYIRLTELIPELLNLVDLKKMQFTVAVDVSYLSSEIQKWLHEYIHENGGIRQNQVTLLREAADRGHLTQAKLIMILNDSQPDKKKSDKVSFSSKKLREYFPSDYTTAEMKAVIEQLLSEWKAGREEAGIDEL